MLRSAFPTLILLGGAKESESDSNEQIVWSFTRHAGPRASDAIDSSRYWRCFTIAKLLSAIDDARRSKENGRSCQTNAEKTDKSSARTRHWHHFRGQFTRSRRPRCSGSNSRIRTLALRIPWSMFLIGEHRWPSKDLL
jgi:hypothetical protein